MDRFMIAEQEGRDIFTNHIMDDEYNVIINRWSKDQFANWDCSYLSGATKCVGEIKKRDMDSDKFSTAVMELSKWYKLSDYKKVIHYICIYDDYICIYDVTSIKGLNQRYYDMPKTTMGDTKKVPTLCVELPKQKIIRKIKREDV